ncbi:MAG: Ni/Fe-hydrogenase cytochrome b subunit [Candidatus Marinimicrobia bacterium]|nr:Ni/Fe-hydrogenase cytochrome b subunit [Candidatus Neomarinimicrobiota bacterium]
MSNERPLGGKILTKPFIILSGIFIIALILLIKRFMFGLGAVTNLSDGYPWGLWIVYDVVTGTAIACGGYAMAILIYIFNKGKYHPLIKPALLASVFGYTLAGASIFFDVGRYWQLYNVFLPEYANVNSIMFEVAACIGLYVLVLWIEFSPTLFKGMGKPAWAEKVQKVMFIFIGIGILLPTMHQSSLGTLLIIAGHKVNPLWQTMMLPLLFLISAIAMGYGMVVFESIYSSVHLKRPLETPLLSKISGVIPWLLIIFLGVRFVDLAVKGVLTSIFSYGFLSFMFLLEILLFLIPILLLFNKEKRSDNKVLFYSAVSVVLAGSLYRFNAFLVAFNPGEGWNYFPSASEIIITLGLISFEIMAYLFLVKKAPVLTAVHQS